MFQKITYAATASLCLGLSAIAGAQTATVNFNTTYQTIRGFGGSTAWTGVLSTAQANGAWGTTGNQLGLTINRARIDPGGQANWGTELANAKLATSYGAIEFATPWTPPASMKSNNSVDDGSLNTNEYGAYATYLESFVTYMANNGVDLYAISMQNEPNYLPSYESCGWTAQQMDTWVANNSSVLTTKLMMPESTSMNFDMSDPTLDDPNAVGHVSIIAGHLYGATISYYTNAEQHGKEVWATEHYLTPANGSTPSMADAIAAAQEVHTSMTVGQYNAYVWWWFAYPGNTSNLINSDGSATYYGYAIGQFSRFVRPGSVMVAASSPASGVDVSAYKTSTGGSIVAVNSNSNAETVSFSLTGLTPSSATPWETTSAGGLMQQGAISVSGSSFSYTLPAQSIVTLVLSGSGSTSCSSVPSAPGSLSATAASSSSISLSWPAVTAPANCTISGYTVYRSTTNGFTLSTSNQIASVASGTAFSDANLAASTTYYYKVEAADSDGNSAASSQASAETLASSGGGSFALSVSASSLSVTQGASATDTISVSDSGGFTGSVSLAVSGLPSGVTATIGTNPTTGSSPVTFSASSSAATGTSTVTITGTSGSTSASTSISLMVNASTTTGFGCHVVYAISSQWPSGFGAGITLENTGTTNWSNWTLTWTFANGQTVTTLWNGTETQSGANVTVSNLSYNGSIPAGGSYNGMGFNGTWNNSTNSAPTSFAVNGTACH